MLLSVCFLKDHIFIQRHNTKSILYFKLVTCTADYYSLEALLHSKGLQLWHTEQGESVVVELGINNS